MNKLTVIVMCMLTGSGQALAAANCVNTIIASTPTAGFVDNGDGTVLHTKTGLM